MRRSRGFLFAVLAALLTVGVVTVPAPQAQAQVVAHPGVVSDNPVDFTPHVLDGKVGQVRMDHDPGRQIPVGKDGQLILGQQSAVQPQGGVAGVQE